MSQKQEIFEDVLQAHKTKETSRATTILKQRQAMGTPREFFRTFNSPTIHSLTRPPIAQQPLSIGVRKKAPLPPRGAL